MIVLGISAYYHDSAAALVKDGVVIAAAEEERFNRIKHYEGFPEKACKFCLSFASLSIEDVDKIVFYEKPFIKFERILRTHINYAPMGLRMFLQSMPVWLKEKLNMRHTIQKEIKHIFGKTYNKIEFCQHHLSHATLAYLTSPFETCTILVADAVGEDSCTSIYKANKDGIKLLKYQQFPHSLGLLYSSVTYYLGFKVNSDEYKVMGLAPYGNRTSSEYMKIKSIILNHLVKVMHDGSISLNDHYFTFMHSSKMMDEDVWYRLFGFPKREKTERITTIHENLALAIQDVSEDILTKMTSNARTISGEINLCIVGGCALNSAAVGKINQNSNRNTVFVPYSPGDAGAAIGCALYACYGEKKNKFRNETPFLGPEYSDSDILHTLSSHALKYDRVAKYKDLCIIISHEIESGKVVGWFQGRMEFGPRALGNRSILADPRNFKMKDIVNNKIKFRETFRPFAPAILAEYARTIFDCKEESPYMSATYNLNYKDTRYPAITHVDNTARIQTVSQEQNKKFYDLLTVFNEITGCPLLLNTSFNIMGEPIVCTPLDAINTFQRSGIDILVMNQFIVKKL